MDSKYEDLIEYALTYGCRVAAKKFQKTDSEVSQLLTNYGIDNGTIEPCPCRRDRWIAMCFQCTGHIYHSQMICNALNS